jgi:5-dehydro-2-deoxygluconokinase
MYERLKTNNFLVIGRAGMDLYADPPGTQIEEATGFTSALGGSAANIAVALARQGCKVTLLTAVSDDAVGRYTARQLTHYGVDASRLTFVGGEARNSLAVVETRIENCQSIIYRNGAADFAFSDEDAASVDYGSYGAVIVTGTCLAQNPSRQATLTALDLAGRANAVRIIDIDYRPYSWASKVEARNICLKAAEQCEIIVGNDVEFSVLAGGDNGLQLAEALGEEKHRIVIYKMGEHGSITFADGQRFDTPIFPVKALKPTGAGDGFMGGFVSALSRGKNLQDAVRQGAATAAIVVTKVGCAPAMPSAEDVETFIQSSGA